MLWLRLKNLLSITTTQKNGITLSRVFGRCVGEAGEDGGGHGGIAIGGGAAGGDDSAATGVDGVEAGGAEGDAGGDAGAAGGCDD